jgi:hypothetical protein
MTMAEPAGARSISGSPVMTGDTMTVSGQLRRMSEDVLALLPDVSA